MVHTQVKTVDATFESKEEKRQQRFGRDLAEIFTFRLRKSNRSASGYIPEIQRAGVLG